MVKALNRISIGGGSIAVSEEGEIRPQVRELLDFIAAAKQIHLPVHTTRAAPPPIPEFSAGRFGVPIESKDGSQRYLVFQTEHSVGHLGKVVVGKTQVDGWVSETDGKYNNENKLNPAETEALLVTLARREQTDKSASLGALLKYAWAIVSNGNGTEPLKALYEANELPLPAWMSVKQQRPEPGHGPGHGHRRR